MVSIRNLYLAALAALAVDVIALLERAAFALAVLAPLTSLLIAASATGRRWRLSDLGAGEELRAHEQARRWLWQPAVPRGAGERVHIVTQGQIVRERTWPPDETFVPLTAADDGPRVPRRSGRHVFTVGATGSGKTTSALRAAAGRAVKDGSALFFVDQKGDPPAHAFLRDLAAALDVPFIVFDPRDPASDHWQPLWGDRPAEVVARVLAGIETSEPYYADTLRMHVGVVASVLHAAGYWPPSLPLLVEASQCARFDRVVALARALQDTHPHLWRRVDHQAQFVSSKEGEKALGGGLVRLDLVMGEAWRSVLAPRTDPAAQPVGVNLAQAIRQRAVVLWRTHVDQMPDEAKTVTAVILNDIQACAVASPGRRPRAVDLRARRVRIGHRQRRRPGARAAAARPHPRRPGPRHHPVAGRHRSADRPSRAAGVDGRQLLGVHRAPPDRPGVPRLGRQAHGHRRAVAVDRPDHAYAATGAGSRRRVRQFRVSSDTFAELDGRPSRRAHHARTAARRLPRQGAHAAHRHATADRRTARAAAAR